MKVFISDFHISSPLFTKKQEMLELFNNPKVEDIYILGDIFDDWEEDPRKTAAKNSSFIEAINNNDKIRVIIKGNHDPSIEIIRDIFPNIPVVLKMEIELFGKKAVLIHGDETDTSMWWTKILFYVHYVFERVGLNLKAWLRNTVHKYLVWRRGVDACSLVFKTEKALFEKYSKDYDIIISGHTHLPKIIRLPEADFVNSGSILYKPTYLVAEANTLVLKRL